MQKPFGDCKEHWVKGDDQGSNPGWDFLFCPTDESITTQLHENTSDAILQPLRSVCSKLTSDYQDACENHAGDNKPSTRHKKRWQSFDRNSNGKIRGSPD